LRQQNLVRPLLCPVSFEIPTRLDYSKIINLNVLNGTSTPFLVGTKDYTETTGSLAVTGLAIRILNDNIRTQNDAFEFNHSYVPKLATQCSEPNRYLVIEIRIEQPKRERLN
jgi:hypothetical protein